MTPWPGKLERMATEKAFAAGAVAKIETVVKEAKYTLKHFGGIECLLGFLHVYWFQGNELEMRAIK